LCLLKEAHNPFYSNKASYNDRALLISYDARQYPFCCKYTQNKKERARIHTFTSPSGSTTFAYDTPEAGKKGGSTTVFHPNGSQTIYRFNASLLVESMENYSEGRLVNKKSYGYDSKQHLQSLTISDGEGQIVIAREFECDKAGNPIKETVSGDFGSYSVIRQFDQNRLVFENWDTGLQYAYTYLGNSRLLTAKKTLDSGKCLRETVYEYDKWNNLITKTEVGKTITTYSRYQTQPHLHRIELEEKRDVNGNLLYKIHYQYDRWGNVAEEEHFDANGTFAYKIQRQYNESGDLLSESNPLNQTAAFRYDARGRCTYEEPISNQLVIDREYDDKGNLLLLRENDWETRYRYNSSDELIEKTDHLGYVTKYSYHPIHYKPTRIETQEGVTDIVYDAFGREIKKIDALGGVTEKQFNSYGDTTSITHPNGGKEFFSYFPSGRLQSHVSPGGLVTTYTYDFLGRVTQKTIGNQTHGYIYDGYHLIQKIDPAGHTTHYQYDFFDRKVQKNRAGRITRYGYDALGFRAWKERGSRRISTVCDALGRVISKTDGPVETRWTYDPAGNRASRNDASFAYDAHNRLIESINDNGYNTIYQYEKNTKVTLNPRGDKTLEVCNHQDQLLAKYLNGELIEERAYDPLYRCVLQDHLLFGYTPTGQKSFMQDDDKITRWSYTPDDLVVIKQKSDGTCLTHEYDEQKRLIKINSREFSYNDLNQIIGGSGFSRTLDPFGNILKETWDNGLWIESQYDDWDRPLLRILPDHSKIQYEYEGPLLKQVTRISKTGSVYTHTYDQFDLKGRHQVARGLFETTYEYDRCGSQTLQRSPYFTQATFYDELGNIIQKGNKTYQYDALSQMTTESDSFTAIYDSHYHILQLNNCPVSKPAFDKNGNVFKPGFIYDEFDQLIVANGQTFTYDALSRRLKKGDTTFCYIGNEEIASFETGTCKELNIHGVAIEIDEKLYIPIQDVQGITRYLIDAKSQAIAKENHCDPFGNSLTNDIPYAYLGKRFDPETGLIYFGKRFYDPYLRQWMTPDPMGPLDHSNLYQYVFNNPFSYCDPTGEFVFAIPLLFWGAGLVLPSISTCVTAALYGAAVGAVAYGGYKALEAMDQQAYIPLLDSLWRNTNPFEGPVSEDVYIGDSDGNIIPVPENYQLGGSKDGSCIQQKDSDGKATGLRKDGKGHPPSVVHQDPRSQEPHAHVPGITNSDGTPWLPIN